MQTRKTWVSRAVKCGSHMNSQQMPLDPKNDHHLSSEKQQDPVHLTRRQERSLVLTTITTQRLGITQSSTRAGYAIGIRSYNQIIGKSSFSKIIFPLINVLMMFGTSKSWTLNQTSPHVQPLDQGIIKCFKAHYRARYIQWAIGLCYDFSYFALFTYVFSLFLEVSHGAATLTHFSLTHIAATLLTKKSKRTWQFIVHLTPRNG